MRWERIGWAAFAVALGLGWTARYGEAAAWALRGWRHDDGPAQALIALGLLAAAARAVDLGAVRERLGRPPHLGWTALGLAIGAPVLGGLAHRAVPLDVVHAAAGVATAWGLAGLYLSPDRWRGALPVALLLGLLLPVTGHLDVLLGWPLRKATAAVAASALGALGAAPVAAETVLRVEGGVAHVDLPCAGVRSLWSGGALLLAATAWTRRPLDAAWLAIAALAGAVLVAANAARVTTIVGLVHVLGWPLVADVVHEPLGVLGFLAAAAVGAALLAARPERRASEHTPRPARWAAPLVAFALVARLSTSAVADPSPAPALPEGFTPLDASASELALVGEHGGAIAKGAVRGGTVALVAARSWIPHHVPEACLEAAGFSVGEDHPAWVDGAPLRVAAVRRDGVERTALWWLQADGLTTDDHVVRIRDGFTSDRPWVLVSLLLDGQVDPADAAGLVTELRASVARTLEGT